MSRRVIGLMAAVMAIVVAIGFVVAQSNVPEVTAKTGDTFQLDLVIQSAGAGDYETRGLDTSGTVKLVETALAKGRIEVDSTSDVTYVSNIGSSGLDGNTVNASSNVDSFLDIEVEISGSRKVIPTEMVAMSLHGELGDATIIWRAVDLVREAAKVVGADVIYAHVTILK